MKFVFFGYDFSFPVLQRLLDDGHELVSLFTFECDNVFNFNREIIKCAQNLNVPFTMARPKASDIEFFTEKGSTLFLSCGYPNKIPPIEEDKAYGVNTHPSRLPKGRGLMPTPRIIMHEPDAAGFTVHKLTAEFDAGDILYQEEITLTDQDTVDSYSADIAKRMPSALSKIIADLSKYWAEAKPQNPALASTFEVPDEAMRTFNWNSTVKEIDLIGRAFGSFGSLAAIDGKAFAIFSYQIKEAAHENTPGTVIEQSAKKITIAAADGYVTLTKFMTL